MVSSVDPEVAAVPMTMAAATPRSHGQSTHGFAKVEQGKSYVLSVNAPNGSGEVELLAADSDTQSEPDMFSLLYTKVENSMQIPFVAVSSWVYVQSGNSSINWLVTPANFSLAVPGVSSGGGESFDPTADQSITGAWTFSNISVPTPTGNGNAVNKGYVDSNFVTTYLTTLELVAESAFETNVLKIPASAPSGIYELEFPGGIASYAFNVIAFEKYDSLASSNQSLLGLANPPLIVTNGTATVLEWMWDDIESFCMVSIPNGSTIASLKCFFSHTQGTETNLLKLNGLNIFTSGTSVKKVVVRQIA